MQDQPRSHRYERQTIGHQQFRMLFNAFANPPAARCRDEIAKLRQSAMIAATHLFSDNQLRDDMPARPAKRSEDTLHT
jgi:hypothetical protein